MPNMETFRLQMKINRQDKTIRELRAKLAVKDRVVELIIANRQKHCTLEYLCNDSTNANSPTCNGCNKVFFTTKAEEEINNGRT